MQIFDGHEIAITLKCVCRRGGGVYIYKVVMGSGGGGGGALSTRGLGAGF